MSLLRREQWQLKWTNWKWESSISRRRRSPVGRKRLHLLQCICLIVNLYLYLWQLLNQMSKMIIRVQSKTCLYYYLFFTCLFLFSIFSFSFLAQYIFAWRRNEPRCRGGNYQRLQKYAFPPWHKFVFSSQIVFAFIFFPGITLSSCCKLSLLLYFFLA